MTKEEAIKMLKYNSNVIHQTINGKTDPKEVEALDMAIAALEQEPRKGEWLRMSDLSEKEDDRYKCSHCGNVVHHRNKINLYTFNNWCGRCGSDNGRKLRDENDK